MTKEQRDWLDRNPGYQSVGKPRAGVTFSQCGTLYADGHFEPLFPMRVVKLEDGSFAVGVAT